MPIFDPLKRFFSQDGRTSVFFIIIGGICLYILLLLRAEPLIPGFSWRYDYVLTPLLLAIFYKTTGNLRKATQWALCFSLTLVLYGVILSEIWGLGSSTGSILAGKLPYSDAFNYLEGSIRLLNGEPLSLWTSRRPLATSWISLNLFLSGQNLMGALASMAFFCTLGIAFFSGRIRDDLGSASAWITHLLLFIFYRNFVGTTLSEQIGFFLGCLAFSLLWESTGKEGYHDRIFLIGLFTLSLGLLARAGTFFILPTLTLYYAIRHTTDKRRMIKKFLLAICVVLMAFGANKLILHTAGTPQAAFGNFSHTLYGLVHGGDWTQAGQDHPEILSMQEMDANRYIYSLAIKRIQGKPTSLLKGSLRAYRSFFFSSRGAYSFITSSLSSYHRLREVFSLRQRGGFAAIVEYLKKNPTPLYHILTGIFWFMVSSLLAFYGCVRVMRNGRSTVQRKIILWGVLGILLSIPFLPPWDAQNMRAYAVSIPFFTLFPAYALMQSKLNVSQGSKRKWGFGEGTALTMGFLLVLFPLLMRLNAPSYIKTLPSSLAPGKEVARIISGSLVSPQTQALFQTDLPSLIIWLEDDRVQEFKQLRSDTQLALAYFPQKGEVRYVYWGNNLSFPSNKWIEVKKNHLDEAGNRFFLSQLDY